MVPCLRIRFPLAGLAICLCVPGCSAEDTASSDTTIDGGIADAGGDRDERDVPKWPGDARSEVVLPGVTEMCDGVDNDDDGTIDEDCDDDGDGYCDGDLGYVGPLAVCPEGPGDCDDASGSVYPGSVQHVDGLDYDCDGRREFMAQITVSADARLEELCVNGRTIVPLGLNSSEWAYADSYFVVMDSGDNVIGLLADRASNAVFGLVATIRVNGEVINSTGVAPSSTGQPYEPSDPQWNQTEWRGSGDGPAGWCDVGYDDTGWGPTVVAQSPSCGGSTRLGELGQCPWDSVECEPGEYLCPLEFAPFYEDQIPNNEPVWVWAQGSGSGGQVWVRRRLPLPM